MRYNWNLYNEYGSTQIDEVFPNFEQFKALRVILPSECSCLNILAYQYPDRKLLGDLEEELLKHIKKYILQQRSTTQKQSGRTIVFS